MTPMMRKLHRWLAIAFTLAVITNLVALGLKVQSVWIGLVALFPLILLMVSGLWMFFQPCLTRRGARP